MTLALPPRKRCESPRKRSRKPKRSNRRKGIQIKMKKKILTLLAAVFARPIAINAVLTPIETSRGSVSLDATAAIAFKNAVVCHGADDRHFKVPTLVTDVPIGILL